MPTFPCFPFWQLEEMTTYAFKTRRNNRLLLLPISWCFTPKHPLTCCKANRGRQWHSWLLPVPRDLVGPAASRLANTKQAHFKLLELAAGVQLSHFHSVLAKHSDLLAEWSDHSFAEWRGGTFLPLQLVCSTCDWLSHESCPSLCIVPLHFHSSLPTCKEDKHLINP